MTAGRRIELDGYGRSAYFPVYCRRIGFPINLAEEN